MKALQQHIEHLTEIRSILHSLKNMAFMDMHKLSRFRQAQRLVVRHIETVAADFLKFYPGLSEVESKHADFPDHLLARINESKGCEYTVTFDKKAAKQPTFELIR